MDNDNNEEQGFAVQKDAGGSSLALDALSQLHGAELEVAAGDEVTPRAEGSPENGQTSAEPHEPLDSLQSALDSYKDWLSSI